MDEPVGLERFFDEVVGTFLYGSDSGFDRAMARNHDDRKIGLLALHGVENLNTVEPAPLKPDIQNDKLGTALANCCQSPVAVCGGAGFVPLVAQDSRHKIANVFLVVDDQDFSCYVRAVF